MGCAAYRGYHRFTTIVRADIVECPRFAVFSPGQEDRIAKDVKGKEVPGTRKLAAESDAEPVLGQDMLDFIGVKVRIEERSPRQGACLIDGSSDSCTLIVCQELGQIFHNDFPSMEAGLYLLEDC